MPRHARLDEPGALHHVTCRRIERRPIVRDDTDRAAFVAQLGRMLAATGTPCYAWALLPNHVHLLLRTGAVPLTTVMRSLLCYWAVRELGLAGTAVAARCGERLATEQGVAFPQG